MCYITPVVDYIDSRMYNRQMSFDIPIINIFG